MAQSMGDYAGYAGDADVCAVISTALDRGIMKERAAASRLTNT